MNATSGLAPVTKLAIRNLPPFSPIAIRMMALLRHPNLNYRDVLDLLKLDAAFSAELLRLANSVSMGCRFPTQSVLQAVSIAGILRISALTVTLGLSKFLKPLSNLPLLHRCWRHNLATALAASELAPQFHLESDNAYTFGLLHDIGRLGLLVAFPRDYVRISEIADQGSRNLPELEMETFGYDHREVGAWLTAQWNLPAELADVCLRHGSGSSPHSPLCRLIDQSCLVANEIGCSVGRRTPVAVHLDPLATSVLERVNGYEQEHTV